jgi:hypothetical protein
MVSKNKKIKVILAFGLSKSGKTTIITAVLGYKMKKTIINGIPTIQTNRSKMKK